MKNVVVCLDGTNNKIEAQTNVLSLYAALEKSDRDVQRTYYQPGVGTFSSPGTWTPVGRTVTRLLGSAFGFGFSQNLGDAYRFVMAAYEPGDRIFVIGFSRGAYTARALVAMLDIFGVFRPGTENLVPHAVNHFVRRRDNPSYDWQDGRTYAELLGQSVGGRHDHVTVHFLGLWDTVNAIGAARRGFKLPLTARLPHVTTIRHAVAIDEDRPPYRPYPIEPSSTAVQHGTAPERGDVEEVWFPGAHSDVGGSFAAPHSLSIVPLLWMLREAQEAGVVLVEGRLDALRDEALKHFDAAVPRSMGGAWRLLGRRRRPLPHPCDVHASTRSRIEADSAYAGRFGGDTAFVDDEWRRYVMPASTAVERDEPPA